MVAVTVSPSLTSTAMSCTSFAHAATAAPSFPKIYAAPSVVSRSIVTLNSSSMYVFISPRGPISIPFRSTSYFTISALGAWGLTLSLAADRVVCMRCKICNRPSLADSKAVSNMCKGTPPGNFTSSWMAVMPCSVPKKRMRRRKH